ncbi:MAG: hypothetical protein A2W68_12610 [Betaproteobacteria bacterium RIFCSPLOWO2_02_64_14]|jgi:hypothetical protein|nr:MAG: hypothetical protein A2W68_12610 [Betaproteobacteria bacterium RIFCSPLOWO2_02_64_14]
MTRRRFTQFIYIFLLLFAQQNAFTHAVWHAREQPPAHHEDQGDASFQGKLCGLHGALSQVLGGVQAAEAHDANSQGVAEPIVHRSSAQVFLELRVPLSRGPPVLS